MAACDTLCVAELNRRYSGASAEDILEVSFHELFQRRIAVVSSFGAASVTLLHLVAKVDRAIPVLFLETGQHFPETLVYRDAVVDRLGLTAVRSIVPDADRLARFDPAGTLHAEDPDLCCWMRKVEPLADALMPFDAWVTGRKRYQNGERASLAPFEWNDGRVKVNPLIHWTAADIARTMTLHGLPEHPLVAQGYRSIGCAPCTSPVAAGEDERAGRWRGRLKSECGIHVSFSDGGGI